MDLVKIAIKKLMNKIMTEYQCDDVVFEVTKDREGNDRVIVTFKSKPNIQKKKDLGGFLQRAWKSYLE